MEIYYNCSLFIMRKLYLFSWVIQTFLIILNLNFAQNSERTTRRTAKWKLRSKLISSIDILSVLVEVAENLKFACPCYAAFDQV